MEYFTARPSFSLARISITSRAFATLHCQRGLNHLRCRNHLACDGSWFENRSTGAHSLAPNHFWPLQLSYFHHLNLRFSTLTTWPTHLASWTCLLHLRDCIHFPAHSRILTSFALHLGIHPHCHHLSSLMDPSVQTSGYQYFMHLWQQFHLDQE